VRVALVDAAVLVDVRLAFVRVADDETWRDPRLATALPLDPGREAGAAATAQVGGRHLGDRLFLRHLEEDLEVAAVSAAGDRLLDRVRVDDPDIGEDDPLLVLEEGVLGERRHALETQFAADSEGATLQLAVE
jgi:hypothetical protein